MTTTELIRKIVGNKGRIFSVTFIKKDGSIRSMTCRLGVSKNIKGSGMRYNTESKDYLVVYSTQDKDYRIVNINTLLRIKANGNDIILG